MLQLLALFAITWLLAWLFDRSNLSVLGLAPSRNTLKLAGILFFITAICCSTAFLLKISFAKEHYMLNPALTFGWAFIEIWNVVRGVLTEELLCRGVLLYVLIKKIGATWAIIVSSVVFGLLHWLNSGVFGNPMQMLMVFAFTFSMGLVLAYAYSKTFSIITPFAIHLGWNLTQNFIFPDTQEGIHVFILSVPPPEVTVSYFVFFLMLLFPKVSALMLDYVILRKFKVHNRLAI